jgi:hypothetical protein
MIFLNLLGYERHFHRIIAYAPINLGGLGLCQLYVEMIVLKINSMMTHINAKTTLGQIYYEALTGYN